MKLTIHLEKPGCGDGMYEIRARGYLAAELFWSNEKGILEEYTAFACIPLGLDGEGVFRFQGGRGIPPEASSVTARAVDGSLKKWEEASAIIPMDFRSPLQDVEQKICVMSDLHLSRRAGRLKWVFSQGKKADLVLLLGDLVNDGLPEQFQLFSRCLEEALPDVPVLAVPGNHDFPRNPLPLAGEKRGDFRGVFQQMAERAENLGIQLKADPRGGFCARAGRTQVIGLYGASNWRKLRLEKDGQLAFLEEELREKQGEEPEEKLGEKPEEKPFLRLILCHAPLLDHNPQRRKGQSQPYLGGDRALQKLLDSQENFLFLSGHTHLSPNLYQGSVEILPGNRIYANVGSTCPCEMKGEEPLTLKEWREPVMTELILGRKTASIISRSLVTGKAFPRGYYRFSLFS